MRSVSLTLLLFVLGLPALAQPTSPELETDLTPTQIEKLNSLADQLSTKLRSLNNETLNLDSTEKSKQFETSFREIVANYDPYRKHIWSLFIIRRALVWVDRFAQEKSASRNIAELRNLILSRSLNLAIAWSERKHPLAKDFAIIYAQMLYHVANSAVSETLQREILIQLIAYLKVDLTRGNSPEQFKEVILDLSQSEEELRKESHPIRSITLARGTYARAMTRLGVQPRTPSVRQSTPTRRFRRKFRRQNREACLKTYRDWIKWKENSDSAYIHTRHPKHLKKHCRRRARKFDFVHNSSFNYCVDRILRFTPKNGDMYPVVDRSEDRFKPKDAIEVCASTSESYVMSDTSSYSRCVLTLGERAHHIAYALDACKGLIQEWDFTTGRNYFDSCYTYESNSRGWIPPDEIIRGCLDSLIQLQSEGVLSLMDQSLNTCMELHRHNSWDVDYTSLRDCTDLVRRGENFLPEGNFMACHEFYQKRILLPESKRRSSLLREYDAFAFCHLTTHYFDFRPGSEILSCFETNPLQDYCFGTSVMYTKPDQRYQRCLKDYGNIDPLRLRESNLHSKSASFGRCAKKILGATGALYFGFLGNIGERRSHLIWHQDDGPPITTPYPTRPLRTTSDRLNWLPQKTPKSDQKPEHQQ